MDDGACRARIGAERVARLATVGADGRPHLVPFCFALEGDVLYSAVDGKPKSTQSLKRLANIAVEPRVCVLADHYVEDWSLLWWVRLDGRARVVDDRAERARALALLSAKYPQYVAQLPAGPVLAIDVERWSGWLAQ